ncbi:MAG: LamG domain-containing protein, partial [Humidesulfovibrio sp.]|uniref:LamG domain-containing protein n=1 Tax=Humidesulfovibrio sp. TaxID=2910988 RepID=UPI0027325709
GLSFSLSLGVTLGDTSSTASVTSTGNGCTKMTEVSSAISASVYLPKIKDSVDFSNLETDFSRPTDLQNKNAITVDNAAQTISFGTLGSAGKNNAAAIWYSGNATQGCLDGNCTMTNGLNTYFEVQWDPTSVADGLVFGVISGYTNTVNALGGDKNLGELMGWAGPGRSGKGIQPPKIGVELDTWYNACGSNIYSAASRCDPTKYADLDHLAYVFWGSHDGADSYDDNRHGAGAGNSSEPVSSNDPDGSGSGLYGMYYESPANWLRGGTKYFFRYELTRITTVSSGGAYCYMLKTWITKVEPSAAFKTIGTDYDAVANPPQMQQVIFLNADSHTKLSKILFGWTEATGLYTQKLTVSKFGLAFKKAQPVYGAAPATPSLYWPMYDNLGTSVSDASGNAVTGTINGTARWVPGIMNNNGAALYFNGGTYVSAANNAATQLTNVGGVGLWFKMDTAQTNVWLLHKGDTGRTSECYGLRLDSNGYLRFRIRYGTPSSNYIEVTSTTKPQAGVWYHVAATWSNAGTPLTIYVNGVSQGSVASNTARNTSTNFYLGAGDSDSTEFTGIIDEVYLYKKVLTQAEITALATGKP